MFQQDRLLPWRSALDNAKLPLELIGLPEDEQRERALTWLNRLGLGSFTNAYPHELSGGMRQRVAIARAFSVQPDIMLADEAFGHLDEVTAAELRETFLALARECGSTAILITHQLEEAISVGDRIVVFGKSAKLLADIHVAQWPGGVWRAARGDPGDAAGQQPGRAADALAPQYRLGRVADGFDRHVGVEEAQDAAGAALQPLVAPGEGADQAALAQHQFDVAADVLRVQQALLERPRVEREHVLRARGGRTSCG